MPQQAVSIPRIWTFVLVLAIVGGGGLALLALLQGAILPAFVISINVLIISATAMRKIQRKRPQLRQNPQVFALLMPQDLDDTTRPLYLQAQSQFATYDHAGALATYDTLTQMTPDSPVLFYNLGIIYADCDRWQEAIHAFSKAIRQDETFLAVYPQRAKAYSIQKQWDNVLADCDHALGDGEDASIYNLRGVAYHALGKYEAAEASYSRAIALDDDNADFYNNRAVARQKQDNYQGAMVDYETALRLNLELKKTIHPQIKRLRKQRRHT